MGEKKLGELIHFRQMDCPGLAVITKKEGYLCQGLYPKLT